MGAARRRLAEGTIAAVPFLPKVLIFGLIVGIASRNAGWELTELFIASIGVNAATAQLAVLEFKDDATVGAIVALTIGLNGKHLFFSASLWPYLTGPARWRRWLTASMLTDSSWAACQLAAHKGTLSVNFALANTLVLTAGWVSGCMAGFFFGAGLTPALLFSWGMDALVPLSMALLLPMGFRRRPDQILPVAGATAMALAWWAFTDQQAAALLLSSAIGMTFSLILSKRKKRCL